jgi:hypothetical protein
VAPLPLLRRRHHHLVDPTVPEEEATPEEYAAPEGGRAVTPRLEEAAATAGVGARRHGRSRSPLPPHREGSRLRQEGVKVATREGVEVVVLWLLTE